MWCKLVASSDLYYLCRYGKVIIGCRHRKLLRRRIEVLALYDCEELLWSRFPMGYFGGKLVGMLDVWCTVRIVSAMGHGKQFMVSAAYYGRMWRIYHLLDLCK